MGSDNTTGSLKSLYYKTVLRPQLEVFITILNEFCHFLFPFGFCKKLSRVILFQLLQ